MGLVFLLEVSHAELGPREAERSRPPRRRHSDVSHGVQCHCQPQHGLGERQIGDRDGWGASNPPIPPLLSFPLSTTWQMSKIKHLIHKVASSRGSKRGPPGSGGGDEAPVEVAGRQDAIHFTQTNGEVHPPPQGGTHHHGRKRDRSLSLTEGKALRCEVREAAEERERRRQIAEKKAVYTEARSTPRVAPSPTKLECTQDPLKDNYGDRPFTNQKSGAIRPPISGGDASTDLHLQYP